MVCPVRRRRRLVVTAGLTFANTPPRFGPQFGRWAWLGDWSCVKLVGLLSSVCADVMEFGGGEIKLQLLRRRGRRCRRRRCIDRIGSAAMDGA